MNVPTPSFLMTDGEIRLDLCGNFEERKWKKTRREIGTKNGMHARWIFDRGVMHKGENQGERERESKEQDRDFSDRPNREAFV